MSSRDTRSFFVDETRHPIVVIRMEDALSDEEAREFLEHIEALESSAQPHALMFDLRGLSVPWSPSAQLEARDHHRRRVAREERATHAIGFVVTSQRSLASMASHYSALPHDRTQHVFTAVDECVRWLCRHLIRAGAMNKKRAQQLIESFFEDSAGVDEVAVTRRPQAAAAEPIAQIALVMDAYHEPAYLLDDDGRVLHASAEAKRRPTPAWLANCLQHTSTKESPPFRIQSLGSGLHHVAPAYLQPKELDKRTNVDLPDSLSEIATLMAQGLTDKQIANETGRPITTVRTYSKRVLTRLELKSRTELAALWPRISGREW